MLQSMYAAKGIGLAAPQIGINKELLVIDVNFEDSAAEPLILINPEITDFGTTCKNGIFILTFTNNINPKNDIPNNS